jgi:hypothetical protein
MNPREERDRNLVIFLVTAPSAVIVWFVFHAVYVSLSASVKAVGYVDASTQIGIALGYAAMIGGTIVLAVVALWSGVSYLRARRKR